MERTPASVQAPSFPQVLQHRICFQQLVGQVSQTHHIIVPTPQELTEQLLQPSHHPFVSLVLWRYGTRPNQREGLAEVTQGPIGRAVSGHRGGHGEVCIVTTVSSFRPQAWRLSPDRSPHTRQEPADYTIQRPDPRMSRRHAVELRPGQQQVCCLPLALSDNRSLLSRCGLCTSTKLGDHRGLRPERGPLWLPSTRGAA